MGIINVTPGQTGLVGVLPNICYIDTNDSPSIVGETGYLNHEVAQGLSFTLPSLAVVITRQTPASAAVVGLYQVIHSGANWSLVPLAGGTKAAGVYTTTGGSASESISLDNITSDDLCFVNMVDNGTNNVTIVQAVCSAQSINVTFSGNPGADTIVNYQVITPLRDFIN